jgi:hypothetical protein
MNRVVYTALARFALLLMVNIAVFMPVKAYAASPDCISIDLALAQAAEREIKTQVILGESAKRAGEVFNSTEPKTDFPVDTVILARWPDGSGVVFLGMGTQMCWPIIAQNAEAMRQAVDHFFGEGE